MNFPTEVNGIAGLLSVSSSMKRASLFNNDSAFKLLMDIDHLLGCTVVKYEQSHVPSETSDKIGMISE